MVAKRGPSGKGAVKTAPPGRRKGQGRATPQEPARAPGSVDGFPALADNSPDSIDRIDRHHRHLSINAAGARLLGRTPAEVIGRLGAGKRPPVLVSVNGYEYRNTVGVMGGKHMISISAAIRKATGLAGGDPIQVTLTLADTPQEVNVPDDFAAALAADERAGAFFAALSNSMQR